ncbi:MAG TPA: DNA ligase D [Candidatus Polarisedimenticolaceae bacterium]|nr:DNA ligase D [Candidatus Polarisedimenticolaceae bacterium]
MALDTYRKKRRFDRTPEPEGDAKPRAGDDEHLAFVIQKHDATRLHYDFRLELDGVMKSWAVPKGPSLDPAVKRMAVHVEDHPIEYNTFEGVIPKGEYGGGPVLLWDRGRWIPEEDPRAGYKKGTLKFRLEGEKLHGSWALVRTNFGNRGRDGKESWLLIKHRDDAAEPGAKTDVVDALPESVVSGRTIEEIGPSFHRKAAVKKAAPASKARARKTAPVPDAAASAVSTAALKALPGARAAKLPAMLSPELATLVEDAPGGDDWIHEIKYDGYRALCRIQDGEARLITRQGNDWTDRFGSLGEAAARLPVKEAWLDGEVVALSPDGRTSFGALQEALGNAGKADALQYFLFDVPYLDGFDLTGVPLTERKRVLATLLHVAFGQVGRIRYSDHVEGQGPAFFEQACRHRLEGVLSKRAASTYAVGKRTRDWLKVKCLETREFVIAGWTDPERSRTGFGSLVLGEYEGKKKQLTHVGRVGTGFNEKQLRDLTKRLEDLAQDDNPFTPPLKGAAAKGAHWVKPALVAEVAFTERTRDGILRHPTFRGLREDKSPHEIVGEAKGTALDAPSKAASTLKLKKGEAEVGGVRITNADKVMYPENGVTKRHLAEYVLQVQVPLMAYLKDRPLTIVRCPDGHHKFCFFQKHIDSALPPGIEGISLEDVEKERERGTYFYATTIQGVLQLVQLGALELHVWGSRAARVEHPDLMIFDLDPDVGLPWARVLEACFTMRERLADLGLRSWLKTTGGKGLHVCVPLAARQDWDEVKAFSKALVEDIVRREPDKYTSNILKARRKGRVFLDYLRNGRGATAISAWSMRARAGATVSMPLHWEELTETLKPSVFTVENAAEQLGGSDPWADFYATRQPITAAMKRAVMGTGTNKN